MTAEQQPKVFYDRSDPWGFWLLAFREALRRKDFKNTDEHWMLERVDDELLELGVTRDMGA